MLTFLIVLAAIIGLAVLIGRGTTGTTGIIDRDAQRMDIELKAIAGYADYIRPSHH
ncbi:hypothetical protein ACFWPK_30860 [Nocardia sp. NPDC058519]|uniref:hypothetical protein n=1 Tax=unclassified Nocardia TaxID=2637762 RepID=UPI00364AD640